MGSWQHAVADRDRTHGPGIATIDAWFSIENLTTHDLRLEIEQNIPDRIGIWRILDALGQCCDGLPGNFTRLQRTGLLARDAISFAQSCFRQLCHTGNQRFVPWHRLPVPLRLSCNLNQLVDCPDRNLHLLMAEYDSTQHHFFRQFPGFRFDHQYGSRGACNHQIQLCAFE
jgi:hypothetical protein